MSATQARRLRRTATLPERLLKDRLRLADIRIRHQHPIGDYTVDFYCASARMVFEIDGIAHDLGTNPAHDAARDGWIEAQGYTVVRIAATEVLRNVDEVAQAIIDLCKSPPPRR